MDLPLWGKIFVGTVSSFLSDHEILKWPYDVCKQENVLHLFMM